MGKRKKILVDLVMLSNPYCGLGQTAIQFSREIIRAEDPGFDWLFLVPRGYKPETGGKAIRPVTISPVRKYFPFLNRDADLWHSTYQHAKYLPGKNIPYVLTVHDLIFLQDPHEGHKTSKLRKLREKSKKASAVIFVSNYTKSIAEKHLDFRPGTIKRVIYNGVNQNTERNASRPSFLPASPFLFSIGELKWKKNFEAIIEMMPYLKGHILVIAGNHDREYFGFLNNLISQLNLRNRVILPGAISDEHKNYLFENCEAFLMPSKHEGFGIPVLEAFLRRKPVFTYRNASLPEIGRDFAFYFDETSPALRSEFLLKEIGNFAGNDSLKNHESAYAKSFTWKKNLDEYINLYREILS